MLFGLAFGIVECCAADIVDLLIRFWDGMHVMIPRSICNWSVLGSGSIIYQHTKMVLDRIIDKSDCSDGYADNDIGICVFLF